MLHCLNGHETIGTSPLPKWRPYWKSLMGRGRKSVYRLGKSKSLIGVFILIRNWLPSHPHPPPLALMRRLCPLFLMFLWKLQFGKTDEIIEPCNTSESCQLIFVGQGANEAKRVAKRDSLTWSSVMLSHLGSILSVVQVLCMLALYTECMAKTGEINTGRVTQLQTLFHQQCKLRWYIHKKHEFRQFSRGLLSILWHTLVNGYEICVSGDLNFMQFGTLKDWLTAE